MKIIAFVLIWSILTSSLLAQYSEKTIKGVLLERFSNFIQWPDEGDEFTICIYKDPQMVEDMRPLYAQRKIHKKTIDIFNVNSLDDSKVRSKCDVLYFGTRETTTKLLNKLHKINILTVSDSQTPDNAIINFYMANSKIKFAIDESALNDANLRANYRLLKSAKIINPVGGKL